MPLNTSGSTGKPVQFYTDFATLSMAAGSFLRELRVYGLDWRRARSAHIGNFTPGKADEVFQRGFSERIRIVNTQKNMLMANTFEPMKELLGKLDVFRPDALILYPVTFQHLAHLKKRGFGEHVRPKVLMCGGYVLDEYTRRYVEDAFGCRMVNVYGAAESGADIAFECLEGTWHVNHDLFQVEVMDEHQRLVPEGVTGHLVMTRLFGSGTPFIRYTGIDDWVAVQGETSCACGLRTPTLKHGVAGRASTYVVLPDGRVFPAASFAILNYALRDLKTFKVKQYQIVQEKVDEVDVRLVIDEELRNVGPSVEVILQKVREAYEAKVGPGVHVTVHEVAEIPSEKGKPAPLVISKVTLEEGFKLIE